MHEHPLRCATRVGALSAIFALACGPAIGPDAELDDDGSGGEVEDVSPDTDDQGHSDSHTELEFPMLPDPGAFGRELPPDSELLEPVDVDLRAVSLATIDATITGIRVRRDFDLLGEPGDGLGLRFEVWALEANCDEPSRLLFGWDTRAPQEAVLPPPELRRALQEDLLAIEGTGRCSTAPKDQTDFAPGVAGWWVVDPCEQLNLIEIPLAAALATSLTAAIKMEAAWRAECLALPEPKELKACEAAVTAAIKALKTAQAALAQAETAKLNLQDATNDAVGFALANNLGGLGPQAPMNPMEKARLTLEITTWMKRAMERRAAVLTSVARALQVVAPHPALAMATAVVEALALETSAWAEAYLDVTTCFFRVTNWIIADGGLGFGGRFLQPPPPFAGIAEGHYADGNELGPSVFGPLLGQAKSVFLDNPIVVDIDAMESSLAAASYGESAPNIIRTLHLGYETPDRDFVTTEDLWGPEPITLLPVVLAPIGTPVVHLGTGPAESSYPPTTNQWVPEHAVSADGIFVQGMGLDLVVQQVDADGIPFDDELWAVCQTYPDGVHCPMGLTTTGTPQQIASGEVFSNHWMIWTTGGIVDPRDGRVVEGEHFSGFRVTLSKAAEGPVPCHVWDGAKYVHDTTLPGCGPDGTTPGG